MKRTPEQMHLPVMRLTTPGQLGVGEIGRQGNLDELFLECDYCPELATWFHFADPGDPRRGSDVNRYACDEHVGFLNRYLVGGEHERLIGEDDDEPGAA